MLSLRLNFNLDFGYGWGLWRYFVQLWGSKKNASKMCIYGKGAAFHFRLTTPHYQ